MSKIWNLIKRDFRNLRGNVIALVVIVGIIVVPTFYAWFNIAGSWDPYGNTKNLKVAVANSDRGYTSDLVPVEVNFGEHVVSDLRESTSIGYTVTTEEDALEGVRSGEYYAAVVIPEDFSVDMMTALSSNPVRPQVKFYQNEKANAIAQIVTNKAETAIQTDINASFAESLTTVGAGVLDELDNYLDDDKVTEVAAKLDEAIAKGCDTLTGTAGDIRGFSGILSSTQGLLGTGSSSFGSSLSSTLDLGSTLRSTAGNVRNLGNTLDGTTSSLNDALSSSSASLDAVTHGKPQVCPRGRPVARKRQRLQAERHGCQPWQRRHVREHRHGRHRRAAPGARPHRRRLRREVQGAHGRLHRGPEPARHLHREPEAPPGGCRPDGDARLQARRHD